MFSLEGKRGLVVGIANEQSIAYGCARQLRRQGAALAVTYLNAKAEPYVRPLAEGLEAEIVVPCDVREEGQLEAVFAEIEGAVGTARLPLALDRLRAARGSARPSRRLQPSRFSSKPWMCPATPSSGWPDWLNP